MTLSKNALGNLINRYKAVLGKCRLLNVFGSLAVAGMLVAGGVGIAGATEIDISADTNVSAVSQTDLADDGAKFSADRTLTIDQNATAGHVTTATGGTGVIDFAANTTTLTVTGDIGASGAAIKAITGAGSVGATNIYVGTGGITAAGITAAAGITSATGITANGDGSITAGTDINAATNIFAGTNITAGGGINAGTNITAGDDIEAGADITATGSITAGAAPIPAGDGSITAGGDINANDLQSRGSVTAKSLTLSSAGNETSSIGGTLTLGVAGTTHNSSVKNLTSVGGLDNKADSTLTVDGPGPVLSHGATFANAGTLNVVGGDFYNHMDLRNAATDENPGVINTGVITVDGYNGSNYARLEIASSQLDALYYDETDDKTGQLNLGGTYGGHLDMDADQETVRLDTARLSDTATNGKIAIRDNGELSAFGVELNGSTLNIAATGSIKAEDSLTLAAGGITVAQGQLWVGGHNGVALDGGPLTLNATGAATDARLTLGDVDTGSAVINANVNVVKGTMTVRDGAWTLNSGKMLAVDADGTLNVGDGSSLTPRLDLREGTVANTGTITVDGMSGGDHITPNNAAYLRIKSPQLAALHAGTGKLNIGGTGGFVEVYDYAPVTLNTADLMATTATDGKIAVLNNGILSAYEMVLNGSVLNITGSVVGGHKLTLAAGGITLEQGGLVLGGNDGAVLDGGPLTLAAGVGPRTANLDIGSADVSDAGGSINTDVTVTRGRMVVHNGTWTLEADKKIAVGADGTLYVGKEGETLAPTLDLSNGAVSNSGVINVDGVNGSSIVPSDNYAALLITSSQLAELHAGTGQLNVGGTNGGFVEVHDLEPVTLHTDDLVNTPTDGKIAFLQNGILGTYEMVLNGSTLNIAGSVGAGHKLTLAAGGITVAQGGLHVGGEGVDGSGAVLDGGHLTLDSAGGSRAHLSFGNNGEQNPDGSISTNITITDGDMQVHTDTWKLEAGRTIAVGAAGELEVGGYQYAPATLDLRDGHLTATSGSNLNVREHGTVIANAGTSFGTYTAGGTQTFADLNSTFYVAAGGTLKMAGLADDETAPDLGIQKANLATARDNLMTGAGLLDIGDTDIKDMFIDPSNGIVEYNEAASINGIASDVLAKLTVTDVPDNGTLSGAYAAVKMESPGATVVVTGSTLKLTGKDGYLVSYSAPTPVAANLKIADGGAAVLGDSTDPDAPAALVGAVDLGTTTSGGATLNIVGNVQSAAITSTGTDNAVNVSNGKLTAMGNIGASGAALASIAVTGGSLNATNEVHTGTLAVTNSNVSAYEVRVASTLNVTDGEVRTTGVIEADSISADGTSSVVESGNGAITVGAGGIIAGNDTALLVQAGGAVTSGGGISATLVTSENGEISAKNDINTSFVQAKGNVESGGGITGSSVVSEAGYITAETDINAALVKAAGDITSRGGITATVSVTSESGGIYAATDINAAGASVRAANGVAAGGGINAETVQAAMVTVVGGITATSVTSESVITAGTDIKAAYVQAESNITAQDGGITATSVTSESGDISAKTDIIAETVWAKEDVTAEMGGITATVSVTSESGGIYAATDITAETISAQGEVSAAAVTANTLSAKTLTATGNVAVTGGTLTLTGTGDDASAVTGDMNLTDVRASVNELAVTGDITISDGAQVDIDSLSLTGPAGTQIIVGKETDKRSTLLSVGELDLNDGMLLVDPDWTSDSNHVVVNGMLGNTINGDIGVGKNSMLTIGTSDKDWLPGQIRDLSNGAGLTQNGITAVLGLYSAQVLDNNHSMIVDGSRNNTELAAALGPSNSNAVTFADNSLLVVTAEAAKKNGAGALSATAATEAKVASGAKLRITDAKVNETYRVLGEYIDNSGGSIIYENDDAWAGDNLSTDSRMVTLARNGDTFAASLNSAANWLPKLDSKLVAVVDRMYTRGQDGTNANARGVRFLSRATNVDFIGLDSDLAAKTIESAARMAALSGAPQMTRLINNAAGAAVTQRTSIAIPQDSLSYGIQSMAADGTVERGVTGMNKTGAALWIMPLYQSQNVNGMETGHFDMNWNGGFGGVALGADYTFESAVRAGINFNMGGGYLNGGGELADTTNRFNFWGIGAYLGYNVNNFGLSADVNYTHTYNEVEQDLPGAMRMNNLKTDITAHAIAVGLRGEYKFETSVMDIVPHIGVRFMNLTTDAYNVKSGGNVLRGDAIHQNIWSFPVGVAFYKTVETGNGWFFKPSLDLSVIPAAGDIKGKSKVRFTGTDRSAELDTRVMDYVTYQGGLGLEFGTQNVSFGLNYNLQVSEHTTGHGVFGTFRYEF